jgi:hypothetical protein
MSRTAAPLASAFPKEEIIKPKNKSMRYRTVITLLTLCLGSSNLARAEEIVPSEEQASMKNGTVEVAEGIRAVTGETDETGHGPIIYYHVPFQEDTLTLITCEGNTRE